MPPKKKVRGESSTIDRKKKKKGKEPVKPFYYKERKGIPDPIGKYSAELWKFLYSLNRHKNALQNDWSLRLIDERVPEFPENYPTPEFLKKLKSKRERKKTKKTTKKGISKPKARKSKGKLYTKSDIESKTRAAIVEIIPMVGYEVAGLSDDDPPVRALADVAGMFLESFVKRLKFHASCVAFRNSKDLLNPLETTLREWKFEGICGVIRYFYEDYAGKNIILFDKCLAEIEAIKLEEHNLDVQKIKQLKLMEHQRLQEQRKLEQHQKEMFEQQLQKEMLEQQIRAEELEKEQQTVQVEAEKEGSTQNDILRQAILQSDITDVLTQEELEDKQRKEAMEYNMESDRQTEEHSEEYPEEHSEEHSEEYSEEHSEEYSEEIGKSQESGYIELEKSTEEHILIQGSYICINEDGTVILKYDGTETNLLDLQTPIDLVDSYVHSYFSYVHSQHSEWDEHSYDNENDRNILEHDEE